MRHCKNGLKLGRSSSHRNAMFRNMVTSLFKYDKIRTTDVKAKELRRWADHVVTLAKRGDLHARRQALAILTEKNVVHKLFEEAGQRFAATAGGYTRIIKIGRRPGDAAPMSLIEIVAASSSQKTQKKASPKKEKEAKAPAVAEEIPVKKEPVEESQEEKAPVAAAGSGMDEPAETDPVADSGKPTQKED